MTYTSSGRDTQISERDKLDKLADNIKKNNAEIKRIESILYKNESKAKRVKPRQEARRPDDIRLFSKMVQHVMQRPQKDQSRASLLALDQSSFSSAVP